MELADTTAWIHRHDSGDAAADFEERLLAGEIATCAVVKLELLWSARDGGDFRRLRDRLDALEDIPLDAAVWARAVAISQQLAEDEPLGHRRVSTSALVVAAAAELEGIAVCHRADEFELIASVTGQPARRVA